MSDRKKDQPKAESPVQPTRPADRKLQEGQKAPRPPVPKPTRPPEPVDQQTQSPGPRVEKNS